MKRVLLYIGQTEVELGEFLNDTNSFIMDYLVRTPNMICKQVSDDIWEGYFKAIDMNREVRIMSADMDLSSKDVIDSIRKKMAKEKIEKGKGQKRGPKKKEAVQE